MATLRVGLMATVLIFAASVSQPLDSARDQYGRQKDVSHPPKLVKNVIGQKSDNIDQPSKVQESKYSTNVAAEQSNAESTEDRLKKRSIQVGGSFYNSWNPSVVAHGNALPLSTFAVWQPQYYQISRPYYIPVWGNSGRLPFYFPPQPLFTNPGFPVDNPPRGYLPPDRGYLPPDPNQNVPADDNSTDVQTVNRFQGPVWDTLPDTVSGTNNFRTTTTTTARPTRRNRPQQRLTTSPPLVHNDDDKSNGGNQLSATGTTSSPSGFGTRRPDQSQSTPNAIPEQELRPNQPGIKQPSRCTWAIVSCCSISSVDVSYRCFEQLGCTGAFWDASPCESEFARGAIATVLKYYNSK